MSRLQTWDDQVKAERTRSVGVRPLVDPVPMATPVDPAVLALLERIARATERTSRRVCIIELIMGVPVLISLIAGGMMLWSFLYR